ncbi:leucyl/phenylalanyl-tRNA--protein transferase [Idiomarina sp. A28L]|uniref:leucyl/phenylalanyl-tRNA--protein transferase n=1 Tax=Idiomarina sp. A28L TaxID=1036674 RepID=UPI0002138892|nr:leucyl/phenylalanyl-tRNA--protein transferase [Idiomarina sp. A28L]EGN75750.1 leucyl/phenylalanyl-tRNA--protein transferase [Idiomarina sp. A28L]
MSFLTGLDDTPSDYPFPDAEKALADPDGLLAAGGCLSIQRLLNAYQHGIFPWYSKNDPILWWSPSERAVIHPNDLYINRSLRKFLKKHPYQVTLNTAFENVIQACATIPRSPGNGTWITAEMIAAYIALHYAGHAHSVEVWHNQRLVGGLYGVLVGQTFCGESMFSTQTNASKVALIALRDHLTPAGLALIDCQIENPHLSNMGAVTLNRADFIRHLAANSNLISPVFLQTTELSVLDIGN